MYLTFKVRDMEKTKTTDNDMYGYRCCYLVNLSAGWTDKRVKNHKNSF